MSQSDVEILEEAIRSRWSDEGSMKVEQYVDKFYGRVRIGEKIVAQLVGKHGNYTVSIAATKQGIASACSCYIGRSGYCHHCHALAITFLSQPESFKAKKPKRLQSVSTPADLEEYLKGVTLESLFEQLKAQGITQKTFAGAIGMNTRTLSAIKSSELRNRNFGELGAVKVACLWFLEHFKK